MLICSEVKQQEVKTVAMWLIVFQRSNMGSQLKVLPVKLA